MFLWLRGSLVRKNYQQKFFSKLYFIIYQSDSIKRSVKNKKRIFKKCPILVLKLSENILSRIDVTDCKIKRKGENEIGEVLPGKQGLNHAHFDPLWVLQRIGEVLPGKQGLNLQKS